MTVTVFRCGCLEKDFERDQMGKMIGYLDQESEQIQLADRLRKQTTDNIVRELKQRFSRKKFPMFKEITYLNISPIIEEKVKQRRARKLFLHKNQVCVGNKNNPITRKALVEDQLLALSKLNDYIALKTSYPEVVKGYSLSLDISFFN